MFKYMALANFIVAVLNMGFCLATNNYSGCAAWFAASTGWGILTHKEFD